MSTFVPGSTKSSTYYGGYASDPFSPAALLDDLFEQHGDESIDMPSLVLVFDSRAIQ
jgi:hypothetical protein